MIERYKNLEEKRRVVREYIRNHPECTYRDIRRKTKIKIECVYENMKCAYEDACIKLPKNLMKRNKKEQIKDVVNYIRENPGCTITEIQNDTGVIISRIFGSILNAYKLANVKYAKKEIKEGVSNPFVVQRCREYESRIINLLKSFGEVVPHVKITNGVTDCILKYKGETVVVEIKDFRARNNITMVQIKQLIKYMKFLGCNNGLIVCPKKSFPKRKNSRNIYIDNLKIMIISDEELLQRGCSLAKLEHAAPVSNF